VQVTDVAHNMCDLTFFTLKLSKFTPSLFKSSTESKVLTFRYTTGHHKIENKLIVHAVGCRHEDPSQEMIKEIEQ
jgi:hypothetical protein